MYAQRIDTARKVVAVLFGVFGLAYVVCVNKHYPDGSAVFGFATLACLAAVFGFFLEYLIRCWVETRRNSAAAWQFSLSHLLLATFALALFLGMLRIADWVTIVLLIIGTILLTCAVEADRSHRVKPRTGGKRDLREWSRQLREASRR